MDVEPALMLLILALVTLMIAFVAAAEMALTSIGRSRIRQLMDAGSSRATVVDALLNEPASFLSTLMLLKSASFALSGAAVIGFGRHQSWRNSDLLLAVGMVWFGLVLLQVLTRALTLRRGEQIALSVARPVQILVALLSPFSFLLRRMDEKIRGSMKEPAANESVFLGENGLRFLVEVGEEEIEEEEKQMIASIFELGETVVREIMVPRIDVVAISNDSTFQEALDVILKNGHSRIPVYEEDMDHVSGFLYAKDLLRCFRKNQPNMSIRQMLRPAYFVPESKKLDELFEEMQSSHVHIAIVVDEYGGTAGLVTIEDLLEEIVGEIQDEYDTEIPYYEYLGPETYVFNARVDVDTVSSMLGIEFAPENIDTLGGFIYSKLGHVPDMGENLVYENWLFTVLSVDARRIEQVRIERAFPTPEPENAEMGIQDPSRPKSMADGRESSSSQKFLGSAA